MSEGSARQSLIHAFEIVYSMYRSVNGDQDFDMSRDVQVRRDDSPGLWWFVKA